MTPDLSIDLKSMFIIVAPYLTVEQAAFTLMGLAASPHRCGDAIDTTDMRDILTLSGRISFGASTWHSPTDQPLDRASGNSASISRDPPI